MAKGNWSVYKPRVRCRKCGYVIKGTVIRIDGYKPYCVPCATIVQTASLAAAKVAAFEANQATLSAEDVARLAEMTATLKENEKDWRDMRGDCDI